MHRFTNYETRLLSQITHCYLGGGVFIAAYRKTHEQVQNKERTNRLTKCQRQADTYCWPLPRSVSGRQLELHSNHSRSDDASCQTIPETSANAWSSPFTLMLLHFVRPTALAFANERAKSSFAGQLSEGLLSIRCRHEQRQQFQAIHLKELVHNSQETAPQTFHETQSNRSGMHMQQ